MSDKIILAIPSKGRLMEQTTELFGKAGLVVRKVGNARGYRGEIEGLPDVEVAFVSSSEIAEALKSGLTHPHMAVIRTRAFHKKLAHLVRRETMLPIPDAF